MKNLKNLNEFLSDDTDPITEEYIEIMDPVKIDNSLSSIKDAWDEWKTGPLTVKSDIKKAQRELKSYLDNWIKNNIK